MRLPTPAEQTALFFWTTVVVSAWEIHTGQFAEALEWLVVATLLAWSFSRGDSDWRAGNAVSTNQP